jgi:hypothetical protein
MTIEIKFKGIDDWNRAVYKVVDKKVYVGSVDKLFDWGVNKEDVDAYFKKHLDELVIFGSTFNKDDPDGSTIKKDIKIVII